MFACAPAIYSPQIDESAFNPSLSGPTYSNANRTVALPSASGNNARSLVARSDKRYFEFLIGSVPTQQALMGFGTAAHATGTKVGYDLVSVAFDNLGLITFNSSGTGSYPTLVASDVAMMAYDPATGKFWAGKNGTWFNSGLPAAGTGNVGTGPTGTIFVLYGGDFISGSASATGRFLNSDLSYTPPSGFKAWAEL